jgi:hypothetical protein
MKTLQQKRKLALGAPSRRRRDQSLDTLSLESLEHAGMLVAHQIEWALQERVGRALARKRGHDLHPDESYGPEGKTYDFADPDVNLDVLIELTLHLLNPISEEFARELGVALMSLKRGETQPLLRPRRRHARDGQFELERVKNGILRHYRFRIGQGMTWQQALDRVEEVTGIPGETIKSWNARGRKGANSAKATVFAQQFGEQVSGLSIAGKAQIRHLLVEFDDTRLKELGRQYASMRRRSGKKRAETALKP